MLSTEDIRWIVGFLSNRWVEITTEGKKISRRISMGLPQGYVFSPLLFNIYTGDCHSLNHNKTKLIQYAYDFGIIESGITASTTIAKLQRTLNTLHETLNSLNLKINNQKIYDKIARNELYNSKHNQFQTSINPTIHSINENKKTKTQQCYDKTA